MKNKADSISAKTGHKNPAKSSRLAPGRDQQADTATAIEREKLQLLRRNLKLMKEPLPPSIEQLFRQEKKFQQLNVKPQALAFQGLEQSSALGQSVKTFTFSEADLMQQAEANSHRQAAKPGKASTTAGGKNSYPASKFAKIRETQSAQVEAQSAGKNTQARAGSGKSNAPHEVERLEGARMPGLEDLLTPQIMQQWISEIIGADAREYSTPDKKSESSETGTPTGSVDSERPDPHRRCSAKIKDFPGNAQAQPGSKPLNSAAASRSSRKSKGASAGTGSAPSSAQFGGNRDRVASGSPDANRNNAIPGPQPAAAAETAFEGIALLQQLVQQQKPAETATLVRQKKAGITARQTTPAAERNNVLNNTAWRQLEKRLRPATGPANAEESTSPPPDEASTGGQNFVFQDESERIAELVNEALVEQAIRHGVDLS